MLRARVTYWGFCREVVKWFDTADEARAWVERHSKAATAVIDMAEDGR